VNSFKSFLAPQMEKYLEYRKSLGYSVTAMDSLRRLDRYLVVDTSVLSEDADSSYNKPEYHK